MITEMQARPPLIRFERRAIEDRAATIEAGHLVEKDQDWVVVQQLGSQNTTEHVATDWLAHMEKESRDRPKQMPSRWVEGFRAAFEAWKKGEDMVVDGTSIKNWVAISKADVGNLLRIGVQSIEDCAAMNEETMKRVGMGARAIKQKAIAWVQARQENGVAAELDLLRSQVEADKLEKDEMRKQLAELRAMVDQLTAPKRKSG